MVPTAGEAGAVHQFVSTLEPHDAVGAHALRLRDALRRAGWRSDIFAESIHDDLAGEAFAHRTYPEHSARGDVVVYQARGPSAVAGYLAEHRLPLVLDIHGVVGAGLFAGRDRTVAAGAPSGAGELERLAPHALLGLARHDRGARALRRAGCRRTEVAPVLADYARVTGNPDALVAAELARARSGGGTDILFVGRVVPSNAQHKLIQALWAYRRLYDGLARLHLVGGTPDYGYLRTLAGYAADLGLTAAVRLHGEVSDGALAASFAAADVFLSLSAGEDDGVALVEAMTAEVPVLLLGTEAARETVGEAALVLDAADPSYIAAAVHRVATDKALRSALTAAGLRRAAEISGEPAEVRILEAIAGVVGWP